MSSPEAKRQAANKLIRVAELEEEVEDEKDYIEESLDMKLSGFFSNLDIMDEYEVITKIGQELSINNSQARKYISSFPNEYIIQGEGIPDIIKTMRRERRQLKGNSRHKMTKAIDNLIEGYSDHLEKCISSIYWLNDYKTPLQKMRYNEEDLKRLHSIKKVDERRQVIDSLCKYWEAELEQESMPYNKQHAILQKTMISAKKDFRNCIANKRIRKRFKDELREVLMENVIDNQGIGSRMLFDMLPNNLHRRCSPNIISKLLNTMPLTNVDGGFYKLDTNIKKNIHAYTAAFIDSDGYITVDRKMNPRVGLVATGDRGKAFMIEIQKALGIGKLHLDQKSPQNTRPVNRLNFYSQADITNLLTKCLPHFRMKGKNAELLLELIKMKQGYKKETWYKNRCDEIFKLMKYENHKDHVGYDFIKEGIDIETVAKLHDNCRMDYMNTHENISTPILKTSVKN